MKQKRDLIIIFVCILAFICTIVFRIIVDYTVLNDLVVFSIATAEIVIVVNKLHKKK